MKTAVITPGEICGSVTAPASKSAMQRVCALALLHKGQTIISNPGNSNDDKAAISIIQSLGAEIHFKNEKMLVNSTGILSSGGEISCGESGLSLRMFAAIAALSDKEIILTGTGSLVHRPMNFFDEYFPLLAVEVKSDKGFLPLKLHGPLVPKDIVIDGSQSSQYLTGLLFAFAKTVNHKTIITVKELKSKPYIDLSMHMLGLFGYDVTHKNYQQFFINPVNVPEKEIFYQTETDWSAAAFLLVAGAVAGEIRVKGLDLYSTQADRAVLDALQLAGTEIKVDGSCLIVNNEQNLHAFEFDATDCPDLFPPLVALAANCEGTSKIKGTNRLKGKESDRAKTLTAVFGNMGIEIKTENDIMFIKGGGNINAAVVSSAHDHRIAMAAAIAALNADGKVTIEDAEAVDKSYPAFYDHLQQLGVKLLLT